MGHGAEGGLVEGGGSVGAGGGAMEFKKERRR